MNKYEAILLTCFLFLAGMIASLNFGCAPERTPATVTDSFGETYEVIVIEGCEYLRMRTSNGYYVLTHKGNCKNPIHYGLEKK